MHTPLHHITVPSMTSHSFSDYVWCVVILLQLNLLITLFLFGYFMNQQDMFASFGFPDTRPILIGLILFLQLIFLPYNEVSITMCLAMCLVSITICLVSITNMSVSLFSRAHSTQLLTDNSCPLQLCLALLIFT